MVQDRSLRCRRANFCDLHVVSPSPDSSIGNYLGQDLSWPKHLTILRPGRPGVFCMAKETVDKYNA